MPDNIAFRYVQAFRASRLHFQNGLHFFVYGNDVSGKRDGVFKNRTNNAVIVNKEHIQRHRRVSHPHTDLARRFEIKQHSRIIVHFCSEHQTAFSLSVGYGCFDGQFQRRRIFRKISICVFSNVMPVCFGCSHRQEDTKRRRTKKGSFKSVSVYVEKSPELGLFFFYFSPKGE